MVRLNANTYMRMDEHVEFVADEIFVRSKEFKSFLYHYKGKRLRESIPNVTPENEAKMLKRLKEDINEEVATMTPQRGRKLLNEVGIIVFPGWDLSASFILTVCCTWIGKM